MRQPRHLAARIILVHDAALRCTHDHRLSRLQRCCCRGAVATRDCFLDLAHGGTQDRATPLVDFGALGDLARGFAGGFGISHRLLVHIGRGAVNPSRDVPILQEKEGGETSRRREPGI